MDESDRFLQGAVILGPDDALEGTIVSPDVRRVDRIPPGQSRTRKWPVLDTGVHPPLIGTKEFRLEITGLPEGDMFLDWEALGRLPIRRVLADMHCVTRWSRLGNVWEGVGTADLVSHLLPSCSRGYVTVVGRDIVAYTKQGETYWSTNLTLADFMGEDCLLAWAMDGKPIPHEHGGPLRLVVPRLYAWKSAKWVCRLHFSDSETPGYWEKGGYHMRGNPWEEERFRFS